MKDISIKEGKKVAQNEEQKPQKRQDNGNRDSKGRFGKGNNANPGGRPKVPEELKEYGKQAPARLRAIADDPDTPLRVKADIERWFAEMAFGKAVQQQIVDASVTQKPVVFAGEDEIAE